MSVLLGISWLLMPWILSSPGHQQPWYWLYRICRSSLTWGSLLSTCIKSMWRDDLRYKYMFMFPQKSLACEGLRILSSSPKHKSHFQNNSIIMIPRLGELVGSGVVLPDGTKTLPEPMLTYLKGGSVAFHEGQSDMNGLRKKSLIGFANVRFQIPATSSRG